MFDFDKPVDRRGTGSLKWDVAAGELPMWVADMDFETAPCVRDAILRRARHGIFGYSIIPDAWGEAIAGWYQTRHDFSVDTAWLIFSTGVVPAISSMVRKLTTPGEKVVLQTPVYNIFFNSLRNNGRFLSENRLLYDKTSHTYAVDFEDLERRLADPETTLMILCNPHNPIGKIWGKDTLARIGALCDKYRVTVISDEIHCDLCETGRSYVPFASVNETCRRISVTCLAPTKAFGIPGLQTAAVMVPDPALRRRVWRGLNTDEVAEPNAFAVDATVAAFSSAGAAWLDELRAYLDGNKRAVRTFIADHLPSLSVVPSEATYLLWIDVSRLTADAADFCDFMRRTTGLYLTAGEEYGESGRAFMRMNVATRRALVEDALERLSRAVAAYSGH